MALRDCWESNYCNSDWTGEPVEVKTDAAIDFDWSNTWPFAPPFSVEWTGSVMIEQPGSYSFA